jgi:hypothetical protein
MKTYKQWLEEGILRVPEELLSSVMNILLLDLSKKFNGKKRNFLVEESNNYKRYNSVAHYKDEDQNLNFFTWYAKRSSLPDKYKKFFDDKSFFVVFLEEDKYPKEFGRYTYHNNIIHYFLNNLESNSFISKHNVTEQDKTDFLFILHKTIQHELGHMIDYKMKLGKDHKLLQKHEVYELSPIEMEQLIRDEVENFLLGEDDTRKNNVNFRLKEFIKRRPFFQKNKDNYPEKYKLIYTKFYSEVMRRLELRNS